MRSWWGKSSSKESKKKTTKESFIDTLHRKFRIPSESKSSGRSKRRSSDSFSEKGSILRVGSRSPPPSKNVSRCQSFVERPQAQPLPLPSLQHPASVTRVDSGIVSSRKPKSVKSSKSSSFLSRPACIRYRPDPEELDGDLVVASLSSECSIESNDPTDSRQHSPLDSDYEFGGRTAVGSPSSVVVKDQCPVTQKSSKGSLGPVDLASRKNVLTSSPKRRFNKHVLNLQVPSRGDVFCSAPDSSMSSPSRSPRRTTLGNDHVSGSAFWLKKPYPDFPVLGSGQCSSPGSGQNSGQNSLGGDMLLGQLFWQPSRGSPEYSPIPSPRMTSPGPSSRIQSGAVTPTHPRAGIVGANEPHSSRCDDGKPQSHPLPLPPTCNNSAATSPSVPRSPARTENIVSPCSRWKKGKLIGRGSFGHVYVGFNSDTGKSCAMKEVTLFSDDAKSKESAKQLSQEVAMLSRLRHPNIVQYYGSETVSDKIYIYLEYVSGGSIYKLLQEYGQFGESAIRNYTQQILSGLAYLHAKDTVHRDIKGANILVDPNGRVKLADFGMAKHITGQSCPLSFKGSPYWMAPEVIKNSSGCNLAVDIWSLGCTVLEMATAKPPWSQYEGVAAMFKIGNSKELPAIPDNLPDEGKDFVLQCLRRNPINRPTAAQLLEHPFVKNTPKFEKVLPSTDVPLVVSNGSKTQGIEQSRNVPNHDSERPDIHSFRAAKSRFLCSEIQIPRNLSCPVSPIGSPSLHSRSPSYLNGKMSPSPISSPCATSGSSTPLTNGGGGGGGGGGVGGIGIGIGSGGGAIPFHHLNKSIFLQEGYGSLPRLPQSYHINTLSLRDPDSLKIARSHGFQELSPSSENYAVGKRLGKPGFHDGQSVLADRVCQQLLKDSFKLNPSLGPLSRSQLAERINGS